MMKETNAAKSTTWRRPLKGWLRLAAWLFLISCLSATTRIVLGLKNAEVFGDSIASTWFISILIGLVLAMVLWVLVRCLSSWRNFRRLLFGVACLAVFVALFYAEEDIRGWMTWSLFKSHWEAKGEKFDFGAFVPPPVPDEQNFAMAPVVTTTYSRVLDRNGHRVSPQNTEVVDQLHMPLDFNNDGPANAIGDWQKGVSSDLEPWQNYYRDLSETTNVFPVAPKPGTPAADVLLALSKYDSIIEELRRAAALPAARFPINYDIEEKFAILLPHLAPLKGCAIVLRLRALAELQAGQSQAALDDIGLALSLTQKIRSEPFLISHLVRIAMFQITLQGVWEGLATHSWSDVQLSKLDQQLAALDFVADYKTAMRGENVCQVATVAFMRHHPGLLNRVGEASQGNSMRLEDVGGYLIPSGWFYQNARHCSQFTLERFMAVADAGQQTISPGRVGEAEQSLRAMRFTPYTWVCKMLLPGLSKASHRFAFAQACLDLARTASALERCRLGTGNYPEALDALAPQFIAKVPRDPIGGQPLHYRSTAVGHFTLYSVGWNEEDDNGYVCFSRSGSVDLDKGDWVWQYPD